MNSLERFQFMLSFAVQASLLTGAALVIERRCGESSVKTRVWSTLDLCILGTLTIGLVFPRMQWANPWRLLPDSALLLTIQCQWVISEIILVGWLTGVCFMIARWVATSAKLRRLLSNCPMVNRDERSRLLSLVGEDLTQSITSHVEIRVGPELLGPSCYQLHRPIVLLPPSSLICSDVELRYVLHHELEHLRTQHPLQAFVQRLVEAVLWFLPILRRAGRRAGLAREFVCDDAATSRDASTAEYLTTLLRFAQSTPRCRNAMIGLSHTTSDLRVRAERLASRRPARFARLAKLAPALLVLCAIPISQIWLPTQPLASSTATFSPWPSWSAAVLHAFDITARDFDDFDARLRVHEL